MTAQATMETDRISIICEVHNTNLERLRTLKKCTGSDLNALKDITKYLRDEKYWTLTDIGDLLFRDRSTIRYYLRNLSNQSERAIM